MAMVLPFPSLKMLSIFVTNEEVLQMVDTEREMMDTLRSRQKRWLGHVLRHDSLLRLTLEGRIQGKKVVEDQELCSWIGY